MIPSRPIAELPSVPTMWPRNKAGVLKVAERWYQPHLVAVDDAAIMSVSVPPLGQVDTGMIDGGHLPLSEHIDMAIALNSINYRFWDMNDGVFDRYEYEGAVGALGMRNAFFKAWSDPSSPLSQLRDNQTPLTTGDIISMFGDIPDAPSRADIFNEVVPRLHIVTPIVEQAIALGILDTQIAAILADVCPLAYGDAVLKKSQLAISEIWVAALDRGLPVKSDLTAFADYQIPNVLRAIGVLKYDDALAQKIADRQFLTEAGEEENAIRGASILAVEKIAHNIGVPVAAVDHYLWTRRKEASDPFHLTVTTAY